AQWRPRGPQRLEEPRAGGWRSRLLAGPDGGWAARLDRSRGRLRLRPVALRRARSRGPRARAARRRRDRAFGAQAGRAAAKGNRPVTLTSYDVDGAGVALLRLDRPEARNAINTQILEEVLGHLAAARADRGVRV